MKGTSLLEYINKLPLIIKILKLLIREIICSFMKVTQRISLDVSCSNFSARNCKALRLQFLYGNFYSGKKFNTTDHEWEAIVHASVNLRSSLDTS